MNIDLTTWKIGLLFAAFSVLLGMSGLVAGRRSEERRIASGMLLQGLVLSFVVGGSYFHWSSAVTVGGIAILGLLLIQPISDRLPSASCDDDRRKDVP